MSLREALAGGGGVKSIQTGYMSASPISGSGEDQGYVDITISTVIPAKCVVFLVGGRATSDSNAYFKSGYADVSDLGGRITSPTNLRLATPSNSGTTMAARWTVVEYK